MAFLAPSLHRGASTLSSTDSLTSTGHAYGDIYVTGGSVHLGDAHGIGEHRGILTRIEDRPRTTKINQLREALYYKEMDDRKARLEIPTQTSVQWVWNTPFRPWAGNNDGFFWISGKPGSGKSTLVRHLASSSDTKSYLSANGGQWTTVEFYFDATAGNGIANSKKGLLRSMLFQLISLQDNSIGEYLCTMHGHALAGSWLELEAELMSTICAALSTTGTRVCAFIDGLDEYGGRVRDLISTLQQIQRRTKMKICLASRPDNSISRILASSSTLQVEQYNSATIEDYIDYVCEPMYPEERQAFEPLRLYIEQEANGVILWARLVVDELVDNLMNGATTKELQEIARGFPKEMESVYARVLQDLTEEQRLHTAVAFYTIEHGLSRFTSSREFPTYDFFVTWTMVVEHLDPGLVFDYSFDVRQFEFRMRAMLGGLLEFLPSSDAVRLVHSTLEDYLHRTNAFSTIVENAIRPYYQDGIASEVFISIISEAKQEVRIDKRLYELEDRDSAPSYDDILSHLHLCNPSSHFAHRLRYLLTAIERLAHVLHDSPKQAHKIWAVVQSPLFLLHPLLCKDVACECKEKFLQDKPSWRDQWCLRYLASHGLYAAFEHGLQEVKYSRPLHSADLLDITIEVVRKAQLDSLSAGSLAEMARPDTSPFGFDGHRLIELLLESGEIHLHHAAIYQIIGFPTAPRFMTRLYEHSPRLNISAPTVSSWFPYSEASLLCCWIWCSDDCYDRRHQASRLQNLLDMGHDVNSQAYPGGSVMHALFDYQDPPPVQTHTRLHHITWPFSRLKFDLLMEAGFDIKGTRDNSILDAASTFRRRLHDRTRWLKLRPAEIAKVRDFDKFVDNVLKPLYQGYGGNQHLQSPRHTLEKIEWATKLSSPSSSRSQAAVYSPTTSSVQWHSTLNSVTPPLITT